MASNFYDKASLVMIPEASFDGTQPSVKPEDRSGDFTFSRGSNLAATRVDVNGLIEKGRENILLYSNDFSQSVWQKNSNASIGTQTATDPFGVANNAWLAIFDGTSNGRIEQQITQTGVRAMSVWVRTQSGTQSIQVGFRGSSLSTYTATTTWQRFEHYDDHSTALYPRLRCDSATTLEMFGFQVESGLVATDYIETGASTAQAGILEDMPRLDYSGGASCPALLLEPQRTNLFTQSEYLDGWNKYFATTQFDDSITNPNGTSGAYKIVSNGANNAPNIRYNNVVLSGNYSYSVFVKAGNAESMVFGFDDYDGDKVFMRFNFSTNALTEYINNNNKVTGYDLEPFDNGWYRLWVNVNLANATYNDIFLMVRNLDNSVVDAGDYFYAWGAQYEAGSYPTSYIPTMGASVTRTHDRGKLTGSNFTDVFSGNGTIYTNLENRTNTSSIGYWARLSTTSVYNNMIKVEFAGSNQKLQVEVRANNVTQLYYQSPTASIGFHKVAVSYNNGDVVIYMDGVKLATYEDRTMPDLDEIYIAGYVDSSIRGGTKKDFVVFPTALTDSECIALTTI